MTISAIELLSTNLTRLREARGWTQDDLAHKAGLHRAYVGHLEQKARNPSLDVVECVAAALEVTMAELFKEPDVPGSGRQVEDRPKIKKLLK